MRITSVKDIILSNKEDIAFIIGNGINRYKNTGHNLSWDDLLIRLADVSLMPAIQKIPSGISLTEFYDILDIEKSDNINLQKAVARILEGWQPIDHHAIISNKIKSLNAPILTTNFETTLAKSTSCKLFHLNEKGFTDYYPWSSYYAESSLETPTSGFGIWHINGFTKYHRSIRLGMSHYMGSVARAQKLLHSLNQGSLFSGKNKAQWTGANTWLEIIFNRSLFVFGLGLAENETFLRWLLIQRTKYFKQFPDRKRKAWYLDLVGHTSLGKKYFLEKIGFDVISIDDYDQLYSEIWT